MEKRLEKLDVLESSWLGSTATKNGFTMESLYGMSHYYYSVLPWLPWLLLLLAARYFYLSMLESHQSRPQLMQDHTSLEIARYLYLLRSTRYASISYTVNVHE